MVARLGVAAKLDLRPIRLCCYLHSCRGAGVDNRAERDRPSVVLLRNGGRPSN